MQNYVATDELYSSVGCIFKDKTGNLWFGTAGGGTSMLSNDALAKLAKIFDKVKQKAHIGGKIFATPQYYKLATVMFTDYKGFTKMAEKFTEQLLLDELNFCFMGYDDIMKKYGIEKIKTIGDSYMCVSGVPVKDEQHAIKMVLAALEMQKFMKEYKEMRIKENKLYFECRLGIHSGPVVAGVVGKLKFAYDIWGDTVNVASRMESNGEPGRVNISESTYQVVKDHFLFSEPREVTAKNKGIVKAYFVVGKKDGVI